MGPLTRLMMSFSAARWMDRKQIVGWRFQPGCSTGRHALKLTFWQLGHLSVQASRQGLGESQSQGARISAPRLNQAHAEKTLQSSMITPDRLLRISRLNFEVVRSE